MFFAGEDELAIHAVASAAYRTIRDLRKKRGYHESPEEMSSEGFFFIAKAFAEDRAHTIPPAIRESADKDPKLKAFVSFLKKHALEIGRPIELSDMKIYAFGMDQSTYWNNQSEVANFLKHADRDHKSSIPLSKVKNEELLSRASSSFFNLTRNSTPEMVVFMLNRWVDVFGNSPPPHHLQGRAQRLFDELQGKNPEERNKICLMFLSSMKRKAKT